MAGTGISLHDLGVEAPARLSPGSAPAALRLADLVVEAAWHGDYLLATKIATLVSECLPDELEDLLLGLETSPAWLTFSETCELAQRIDSFLATLERGGTGAALARSCRDNLATLLVLADWCEENKLPAAAGEARHLHGLVSYRDQGGGLVAETLTDPDVE